MQHKTMKQLLAEFGEENLIDAIRALELAGYFRTEWDVTGVTCHPTQKFKDELGLSNIPAAMRAH